MKNFLNVFYNLIIQNDDILEQQKNSWSVVSAVLIIFLIFAFCVIANLDKTISLSSLLSTVLTKTLILFFCLLFSTLFIETTAKIFNRNGCFKELLSLWAYSLLPLCLIAPAKLLMFGNNFLNLFSFFFQGYIVYRVFFLLIKSIKIVYNLTFSQVIIFFSIPLFGFFITIIWAIVFFQNLTYMFSM